MPEMGLGELEPKMSLWEMDKLTSVSDYPAKITEPLSWSTADACLFRRNFNRIICKHDIIE